METSFIELKCHNCGHSLTKVNSTTFNCPACGTTRIIPTQELEVKIANADLLIAKGNFDEAESLFSDVVNENPNMSDGYWGLLRCKYGLNLIKEITGKEVLTCNKASIESFVNDSLYKKAMQYAENNAVRSKYVEMGNVIERIRNEWITKAQNEKPYDVFISYKESYTDESGKECRTQDSSDAFEIYTHLTNAGFRVFFSRESLRNHTSEFYEPYIFGALNTAKVMILYGQKREYMESTWVKNEWTRYIKKIENGEKSKDSFIVCYEKMSANDLPSRFQSIQALDASRKTFMTDLVSTITRIVNASKNNKIDKISLSSSKRNQKKVNSEIKAKKLGGNQNISIDDEKRMQTAKMLLQRGMYDKARKAYQLIVDEDPDNKLAQYGLFLAKYRYKNVEAIKIVDCVEDLHHAIDVLDQNTATRLIANSLKLLNDAIKNKKSSMIIKLFSFIVIYETPYRKSAIDLVVKYVNDSNDYDLIEKLIQALPDDEYITKTRLLGTTAKYYLSQKKFKRAMTLAQKCEELDTDSPEASWINLYCRNEATTDADLAVKLVKSKDIDSFINILQRTEDSLRDECVCRYLNILLINIDNNKQVDKTILMYKDVIRYLQSTSLTVDRLDDLGTSLLKIGRYTEAREIFDLSISEDNESANSYVGIVCCEAKVDTLDKLIYTDYDLVNSLAYQKAIATSGDNQKTVLFNIIQRQEERILNQKESFNNKINKWINFFGFIYIPLLMFFYAISIGIDNIPLLVIIGSIILIIEYILFSVKSITIKSKRKIKKVFSRTILFINLVCAVRLAVEAMSYYYNNDGLLNMYELLFENQYNLLCIIIIYLTTLILFLCNQYMKNYISRKIGIFSYIGTLILFAIFTYLSIMLFVSYPNILNAILPIVQSQMIYNVLSYVFAILVFLFIFIVQTVSSGKNIDLKARYNAVKISRKDD